MKYQHIKKGSVYAFRAAVLRLWQQRAMPAVRAVLWLLKKPCPFFFVRNRFISRTLPRYKNRFLTVCINAFLLCNASRKEGISFFYGT